MAVRRQVGFNLWSGGETGAGAEFLQVLRFPRAVLIPLKASHSLFTLYNLDTDIVKQPTEKGRSDAKKFLFKLSYHSKHGIELYHQNCACVFKTLSQRDEYPIEIGSALDALDRACFRRDLGSSRMRGSQGEADCTVC